MSDMNEQITGSTGPVTGQDPVTPQEYRSSPPPPSSNRNWIVIVIMAVALVGMIVVGVNSARKGGTSRNPLIANVAGKPAPDFELKEIGTGKTVRLSDLKGKAVVLDFWATWCPPCKAEIPSLVDLQNQYGRDGLIIVGVTMDDASEAEISNFAKEMGINYQLVLGTDKVGDTYSVESLPTTFYVGRDGKLVVRDEGLASHGKIEANIKTALAQGEPVAEQRAPTTPAGTDSN